jgi:hypothetical protein
MNLRAINRDGVMVYADLDWMDVREARSQMLEFSDLWMLSDRYSQLTSTQQTELTTFRQELRDITTHPDANTAGENFPDMPMWMTITPNQIIGP